MDAACLGVQSVRPVLLYAHDHQDLAELDLLPAQFRDLTGTDPGDAQVLVLRFVHAPAPSVRCRRRPIDELTG